MTSAVERFAALVAEGRPEPGLDVGALAIAAGADPELRPERWLAELDRLAEPVASMPDLVRHLYDREGFAGNHRHYYDPRNSLIHEVLARRLGIPITLAVVCLEVGRRAGVAVEGVGMPGHFLVRPAGSDRYLDPFTGEMIDLAACEARFRATTGAGPNVDFGPHLLRTPSPRAILARILVNLRVVYLRRAEPADLEWVLRMRLALPGISATDIVEVGDAMARQGRWPEGAAFLEQQVETHPQWAPTLRPAARALRATLN